MSTIIQIKRSNTALAPSTTVLSEGELAYSYDQSNNGANAILYIEVLNSGGSEVIHKIGGKYYTDIIDTATSTNTANKLVKRDAQGSFSANVVTANEFVGNITGTIQGVASSANKLETARYIGLDGDLEGNVLFDGTQNVTIYANVKQNSIVLGTDTTGAYVANLVQGTGVTLTNLAGEGATPTIAIGQDVGTGSDVTFNRVTARLFGEANTAATLTTGRDIGLAGDLTGNVTFDGSQNVTLNATIAPNSVALGTDTTGAYVANLVAGTGVSLTNLAGEGATPTVAIGQDVGTTANVTFNRANITEVLYVTSETESTGEGTGSLVVFGGASFGGNVNISGNLNVAGNLVTFSANDVVLTDPLIFLADGNSADVVDIGFVGHYTNPYLAHTGLARDASDGIYKLFSNVVPNPTTTIDFTNATYSTLRLGNILSDVGNFFGNVSTGNVSASRGTFTSTALGTVASGTFNVNNTTNILQIAGQYVQSYTGSGSTLVFDTSPTLNSFNIGNGSNLTVDGGTGSSYWSGQSGVAQSGDYKAGVYSTSPSSNNALFTFGVNGSNNMSVGVEGSLFVGTALPSNNGGLNTTYPGWLVVQSGGKFGGTINTLGALQFDDANTGKIIFADGTEQNTAFKTSVLTTANVAEVTNLYFTNTRARAALTSGNGIVYDSATGNITLSATGVTATTYGGATNIPVITVDAYGRLTAAANATISTDLNISGNTGTDTVSLATETLAFRGGSGIDTVASGNTITIVNTGVTAVTASSPGLVSSASTGSITLTNTGVTGLTSAGHGIVYSGSSGNITTTFTGVGSVTGTANEIEVNAATGNITIGLPDNVTIGNTLTVNGDLIVKGNTTTIDVATIVAEDSLLKLANANTGDAVDIGFYGQYVSSGTKYTGLFRDASDGRFKLFNNLATDPSSNTIDAAGISVATIVADLLANNANVTTALSFGNEKHQILPLNSSVLEIRGGLGDAAGALSLAAGNYPTSYAKIYLDSTKKITLQSDEIYFTPFDNGNSKLVTMNTTHTAAVSTTTGAVRVSGGIGATGNVYANYFYGNIDGGTY